MTKIWNKHKLNTTLKKKVFVGISGGVDSSVSAALLKKRGFDVVGVFIKTWQPDFIKCTWLEERRDAMRVCAHLDIPFLTFDFEDIYKREVADYMISEYKKGRTPNPDVMCNKEVKFGAFLKKALEMGADYIATGHYARKREFLISNFQFPNKFQNNKNLNIENLLKIENCKLKNLPPTTNYKLQTGIDSTKDQSYFLWTLTQEQLKYILFPVGHLEKKDVRRLATRFGLPTAEKKDSQGVCFLGKLDMKDFLKHYIKSKKGRVLNEVGKTIGFHDGATFYTLGERHGFTITKKSSLDKPYYVIEKNVKKNTLTASQIPIDRRLATFPVEKNEIILKNCNWINKNSPKPRKWYEAQIRYHGELEKIKIKKINFKLKKSIVYFERPQLVAKGQSIVLYNDQICLGGGIVS